MDKFTVHTGTAVPLRRSNVDTDQIIPAVYLKRVTRTGFEDGLFSAWRRHSGAIQFQPGIKQLMRPAKGPNVVLKPLQEHRCPVSHIADAEIDINSK